MIPLRELRIGNVVQKDGKLHVIQENDFLQVNNFEPVKITAKLLDNVGFTDMFKNKAGLKVISISEGVDFYIEVNVNDTYWRMFSLPFQIKYLHQLQTIIFSLTGTELDISSLLKARQ